MKVSVHVTTYNHERYIVRAIESVLAQVVDFEYEIIVGDDGSTDDTPRLLDELQRAHPDVIRVIHQEQNVGMHRNLDTVWKACRGEYGAVLDGDDEWLAIDKLQRQVDFLDAHRDCIFVFHRARFIDEAKGEETDSYGPQEVKPFYDFDDILLDNFVPSSSIVYRRDLVLQEIPAWMTELLFADWPLNIVHAHRGRLGYIDEAMSLYVRHAGGIWSSSTIEKRRLTIVRMYELLNEHFDGRYASLFRLLIARANDYARWADEIERLERKQTELYDDIKARDEEIVGMHAEIARLGAAAGEREALHARIAELSRQAEERVSLHQQVQALHEQLAELGRMAEERGDLHARVQALTTRVSELEAAAASRATGTEAVVASQAARLGDAVRAATPEGATVAVVSKGDPALVPLGGRETCHFPCDEQGRYLGYHPADSQQAIAMLEQALVRGVEFLVFPSHAFWWLERYPEFRSHVESIAVTVRNDAQCIIYHLAPARASSAVAG